MDEKRTRKIGTGKNKMTAANQSKVGPKTKNEFCGTRSTETRVCLQGAERFKGLKKPEMFGEDAAI